MGVRVAAAAVGAGMVARAAVAAAKELAAGMVLEDVAVAVAAAMALAMVGVGVAETVRLAAPGTHRTHDTCSAGNSPRCCWRTTAGMPRS